MSESDVSDKLTQIRRRDRAITDETWIEHFLAVAPFGFLATSNRGQPFINPLSFVYSPKERAVFIHTAHKGRINTNLTANAKCCFCVAHMGRLLPAERGAEFSVEYASVVAFGRISFLGGREPRERALYLLLKKYFPSMSAPNDYEPFDEREVDGVCVLRLDIDEWSGKINRKPPTFPGASDYPQINPFEFSLEN